MPMPSQTFSTQEIPPGVHLQATYTPDGGQTRQVRILGDEERGYLIAGISDLPEEVEFWFRTLVEAFATASELGIRPDDWTSIDAVDGAEMQ